MKKEERLNLLKLSKPKYVLYWHFIKGYNNPYMQGYIGIAEVTKYANRWNGDFKSNYKGCSHFYNVISKYGEDSIETKILHDGLSLEEANNLEYLYRPNSNIGWNVRQGGGNKGKLSQESKNKISDVKKKQYYPYDKIFTTETREKIRLSKLGNKNMLGKKYSAEVRKHMSESAKKRGVSENTRKARLKKVICVETNVIYNSQVEAEQFTGISHKLISASCCNEKRCAGGYHWRIV